MTEPQPRLRPTEPATLVVAALAAAAVAWLLISNFYADLPRPSWLPVIMIGGLAGFEAVLAQDTWARVHRSGRRAALQRLRRGAPPRDPVEPLVIARFVVLAKASSLAGAIFTGWYGGLLPWLGIEAGRLTQAAADLPPTVGGLVVSAGLMAAALWLERACRVPEDEPDPDRDGGYDS